MTSAALWKAARLTPCDRTLWGVLADALEEEGRGLFVAVRQGIYRHEIIGIYRRLDQALLAGAQTIEEEPDHYHTAAVVEVRLGETLVMPCHFKVDATWRDAPQSPERPLATLFWRMDRVLCNLTDGDS